MDREKALQEWLSRRREFGMSRPELARALGYSTRAVQAKEHRVNPVRQVDLLALCELARRIKEEPKGKPQNAGRG